MAVKLRLSFDDNTEQKFDRLKQLAGVDSNVEVLRRAVAIYELILEERAKGNTAAISRGNGDNTSWHPIQLEP